MTRPQHEPKTEPPSAVDWTTAKRLFSEALELSPDERAPFLSARCADDAETARRVACLLEAHERTDAFLVEPKRPEGWESHLPERIGPYRPTQRLGEGGFGVVYRAEQAEPIKREVAVKVLRPGLGTPEVLSRFRDERQYLAQLDHGDIVKVFDAGVTDDGTAYLVMEYVEGEPATDFAAGLRTADRLLLFARICRAVHAVHQRGVIHRDLKPSNIIVRGGTGEEAPRFRIIDFGIAAAAERADRDAVTAVGAPLGTPRYASPEQVRGDAGVDTRTDVYSLGMILCEMLTGKLPRSPREKVDTPAYRPSTLRPEDRSTLRGDLDRIILKAVEQQAADRYDSASALADDIERYLRGQPVLATRPSALYTARKFVARRRAVSAFLAAGAVALLAGVAMLALGITRAQAAEMEVRAALSSVTEERDRADAINAFLLGDVIDAMNPDITGKPMPRTDELLIRMSQLGDEVFADDPKTAFALLERIGDAQRSLGLFEASRASRIRAMDSAQRAFGPDDERTLGMRLEVLRVTGEGEEATRETANLVSEAIEKLGTEHPITLLAKVHALRRAEEPTEASEIFALLETIDKAGLSGTALHVEALVQLRMVLSEGSDPRGIEMLLDAVDLANEVHGPASTITLDIVGRAGSALRQTGRSDEAIDLLTAAHRDAARTYGPHEHVTKMLLNRLAVAALLCDRPRDGLRHGEELYAIATTPERDDPYFASIGSMLIARGLEELGRHGDAVRWRRERLDRELAASDDVGVHHVPRARLVITLVRAGQIDEAASEFDALCKAGGPREQFRAAAAIQLARALAESERTDRALAVLDAERRLDGYPPETAQRFDAWIARIEGSPYHDR